jgi:hypothetical protein
VNLTSRFTYCIKSVSKAADEMGWERLVAHTVGKLEGRDN